MFFSFWLLCEPACSVQYVTASPMIPLPSPSPSISQLTYWQKKAVKNVGSFRRKISSKLKPEWFVGSSCRDSDTVTWFCVAVICSCLHKCHSSCIQFVSSLSVCNPFGFLRPLRPSDTSQARVNGLKSCVIVLRILRDMCNRHLTWEPLKGWVSLWLGLSLTHKYFHPISCNYVYRRNFFFFFKLALFPLSKI